MAGIEFGGQGPFVTSQDNRNSGDFALRGRFNGCKREELQDALIGCDLSEGAENSGKE